MKESARQRRQTLSTQVSVPLRGNGRERGLGADFLRGGSGGFQSPCGEMVVKGNFTIRRKSILFRQFQSPCGEMVVKALAFSVSQTEDEFQSPCGEMVVKG